jgi:hypothetical protein
MRGQGADANTARTWIDVEITNQLVSYVTRSLKRARQQVNAAAPAPLDPRMLNLDPWNAELIAAEHAGRRPAHGVSAAVAYAWVPLTRLSSSHRRAKSTPNPADVPTPNPVGRADIEPRWTCWPSAFRAVPPSTPHQRDLDADAVPPCQAKTRPVHRRSMPASDLRTYGAGDASSAPPCRLPLPGGTDFGLPTPIS